MTKFVFVFLAALAFEAAFALHTEAARHHEIQELLKKVQIITTDASSVIQNISPYDHKHIHVLYSASNELAHNVHDVVYNLQKIFDHNQDGQDETLLHDVVSKLSEIVRGIHQAMHHEPMELKDLLKTQVQGIAEQAQRLAQIAQREQVSQQINDEIEDALSTLLASIEQFQIRNRLQHKSEEEIKSLIYEVVSKVSETIENVKYDDENTIEAFIHHAHYLAHHVREIVHKIQKQSHDYDGEVQKILEQVAGKLGEIQVGLEQVDKAKIWELKNKLTNNLSSIFAQIERLVKLMRSDYEKDVHHLSDLIGSVLARSIVAAKQLKRQVQATVQNHHMQ